MPGEAIAGSRLSARDRRLLGALAFGVAIGTAIYLCTAVDRTGLGLIGAATAIALITGAIAGRRHEPNVIAGLASVGAVLFFADQMFFVDIALANTLGAWGNSEASRPVPADHLDPLLLLITFAVCLVVAVIAWWWLAAMLALGGVIRRQGLTAYGRLRRTRPPG